MPGRIRATQPHLFPEQPLRIPVTQPLFAWEYRADSPSIASLRDFLAILPDGQLLDSLRPARGKGRDDYPVHTLWGVVVLTIALRHAPFAACLGELTRNAELRRLIGIESERHVPQPWNVSRFLDVLGRQPHLTPLREVFDVLVQRLGGAVPELGHPTAADATAVKARRKPAAEAVADAAAAGLPQAAGGRKEYKDEAGQVVKVVEWFGYQLHLLVEVTHEVALAYRVSATGAGDNELLPEMLRQAQSNLPAGRIRTLASDKAADDGAVPALRPDAGIKPLIQNRALGKEELERPRPGRLPLKVVHDEAGTLYGYDTMSTPPVRHPLAYIGYEKERETLKYRGPAGPQGWSCPRDEVCNAGKSYGLTVRVPQAMDRRRFPPMPRPTQQFERLYQGRPAVERVKARLKIFWGADDGHLTGARRFPAFVGTVLVVHRGLATWLASAPRGEGTLGQTRLSPIAEAFRGQRAG